MTSRRIGTQSSTFSIQDGRHEGIWGRVLELRKNLLTLALVNLKLFNLMTRTQNLHKYHSEGDQSLCCLQK